MTLEDVQAWREHESAEVHPPSKLDVTTVQGHTLVKVSCHEHQDGRVATVFHASNAAVAAIVSIKPMTNASDQSRPLWALASQDGLDSGYSSQAPQAIVTGRKGSRRISHVEYEDAGEMGAYYSLSVGDGDDLLIEHPGEDGALALEDVVADWGAMLSRLTMERTVPAQSDDIQEHPAMTRD